MKKFEHLGYLKEFYSNCKLIGAIKLCDADRDVVGYFGRKTELIDRDITLDNKKKIKAGSNVTTILYPLSGKHL